MNSYVSVGRSSSKCGHCGRGASCHALAHDTIIEYGPDTGKPGCGAIFLWCTPTYTTGLYMQGAKHPMPRRSRSGL